LDCEINDIPTVFGTTWPYNPMTILPALVSALQMRTIG